jgi:tRNA (cmo5U34)-methyltransferase
MGAAAHLGIRLRDYDARIRTFIPRYEEMLDTAAAVLTAQDRRRPLIVDLGTGSGALAGRCAAAIPGARVIGIDEDEGMLGLAKKRLRARLTVLPGNFLATPLPRCDAVTASFSLHHVRTRPEKAALYRRVFAALRPAGLFVNADCCVPLDRRLKAQGRAAWRAHLERRYSPARAEGYLRAWAKEDSYFELNEEVRLLERAGFRVDVPWRRDWFAVVVGVRPASTHRLGV